MPFDVLYKQEQRIHSILSGTSGYISIDTNSIYPGHTSYPDPFYSISSIGINAVLSNYESIQASAPANGISADLLSVVVYTENAHGWYDVLNPFASTARPGNVNPDLWGGLAPEYTTDQIRDDPAANIELTARVLSGIENRTMGPTVASTATLFNNTSADKITGYGKTVEQYHKSKPWLVPLLKKYAGTKAPPEFDYDKPGPQCFLAGTMVAMWSLDLRPDANGQYDQKEVLAKTWEKPIEKVTPEDWVVSYSDEGGLKPGRVTQTFQNHSKYILDVHGLMITPGHITYCAPVEGEENRFAGKHVAVMDILRSDGALMKADGTLIRAATGCEVGSEDDEQFWVFLLYQDADGKERVRDKCQLRFGTRWMQPDGNHFSMREYLDRIGVEIIRDGAHKGYACFKNTGVCSVFSWTLSESLPKPEDFVLQRSQLTLEEIYEADEWETMCPQMPMPVMREAGRPFKRDNTLYAGRSCDHLPTNVPHSMRISPNQPTMSRTKEAKQRKGKKRTSVMVH